MLAKIRNWFTAGIKTNDKDLLSVILEVIKKMNIDGRRMAGIKLGKPLILLMKKEEPSTPISEDLSDDSVESAVGVVAESGL